MDRKQIPDYIFEGKEFPENVLKLNPFLPDLRKEYVDFLETKRCKGCAARRKKKEIIDKINTHYIKPPKDD